MRRARRPPLVSRESQQRFRVRWLQYATPWFRYLMLSPAELERHFSAAGWTMRRLIDDGSPRYQVVLEHRAGGS